MRRLIAALAAHKVLTCIGAFCVLAAAIVYAADPHASSSGNHSAPAPGATAPSVASATPATVVRKAPFPPGTLAAFRAFAATGDASKVHLIRRTSEGLPSCPEPTIYVTVSHRLTGRALEADLSAFFVQSGLISNHCQAVVFAFHSRRDYRAHWNDGYTAGRVALTNNSSGPRYNLEVDAGDVYSFPAQFDFNF